MNSLDVPSIGNAMPIRPTDTVGRDLISIKSLLEWSFATECASLDFDEVGVVLGIGLPCTDSTQRVANQLALGTEPGLGVRPDTSIGRSYPADDAEIVATILRNTVRFDLACRVADLARACRVPKWDLGQQRIQPKAWGKKNHLGKFGKTEICREISYVQHGRKRVRKEYWVPCEWVPSAQQIAAARRGYLDWWGALLAVKQSLSTIQLSRFCLTDSMPEMEPWRRKELTQSSFY